MDSVSSILAEKLFFRVLSKYVRKFLCESILHF